MNTVLTGREILIVDDESLLRKRLARYLEGQGAQCTAVGSFEEGKNALQDLSFDFGLFDVHLPDGLGLDLLEFSKGISVVIMTADGGWELAVDAMKRGAADYVAKPFDMDELPLVFGRCISAQREGRSREHRIEVMRETGGEESIYFGTTLERLHTQLQRIIAADARLDSRLPPILIEGETGTGKSTIARWIHANGPRRAKEIVVVNCAALPESLAESELFGHEKGAFTDAKQARIGLFEAADGGTLFLDEIASLSQPLQAKVLVAIEEGRIRKVGGSREVAVDARVLAASNRNLKELSASGEFRDDLYHRLNLFHVSIPPLRDRQSDIVPLAEHLLRKVARRYRYDDAGISGPGKQQLLSYGWPGNIRELAHELERAIVMGEPKSLDFPSLVGLTNSGRQMAIGGEWLNPGFEYPEEGFDLESAIDRLIEKAIEQSDGNVSNAARLLGVQRDYIRYRIKKRSE